MIKKYFKVIFISVVLIFIVAVFFLIVYIYSQTALKWGGKYYITICSGMCPDSAQTWPVSDNIVIKREKPTNCQNIIVRNPNDHSNTQTAIQGCYFEVAEKLRDKSVCDFLNKNSPDYADKCKKNIDNKNSSDLGLLTTGSNRVDIYILKEDNGKELQNFIRNAVAPYLYITDLEKKYGYDFQLTFPDSVKSVGQFPVKIKLIPQNIGVDWTIEIHNPYNVYLR
ncbi:MAG: hypothetical protein A2528_01425 [Candidatus Staskawiczbacteria bacterium RIFOXYD2_FULL_37_9]|uniref:Uncharacterized protein n=1 Tax=Candidatus Staskawiczbacteria bacterium RIFOXYB1_FULL_37_44 TaxID=1802223 RepID=A0A1G2IWR3_9BACT|nr:MAG: hypothetical protein A2358_03320 [Candidatus Staskawiczbacteria bacterium RIFOXYB1_FULL_37_44]OGZ84191.1 MAG: hypothetical protein A2416_00920 [Candidatus Staskawiczbacteria bacterium RIFOXYC1_FULL_37_52]OGZ88099.1 MAG: hypothetical protein A2444_00045 [Candidatus Staskawiczbacteria bacterium RIFOXYC2_FULL_37_19]OGZ89248.1 MAG: hypothetical protein A2581_04125 [Candidatus Staskawiczbacteria bacterium RIFOXYD1_FULL_37_110]OGZ94109.1 MAG: hypothetical protein A2528_01425 [Candidatus Stask